MGQTTAKYREKAWDAKERGDWEAAAKYYGLALKHYPKRHAGSEIAVADKAGLRRLRDEMRDEMRASANAPAPDVPPCLVMQAELDAPASGQTYFAGSGPKRKGKKAAKKKPKKRVKKGSGSLAAFGVMPDGQKTFDEIAEEMMR